MAGPSQVSPASSAQQGPSYPVCPWVPSQGRSPQHCQGPCRRGALPGWVDVPVAAGGEAGWRASKANLQPAACTLVIPASQGAGESFQTPEPPARVCRWRPGCQPQPLRLCGPGHGCSGCTSGTEPHSPAGEMLTSGTEAAMLCTVPSTQRRGEGRSNCKVCQHHSVKPYGRLVILHLAFSTNSNSRVSSVCKAFGLSQHALVTSQLLSREDYQLTWWQNDQLHQLGSLTGCNQAQINIL